MCVLTPIVLSYEAQTNIDLYITDKEERFHRFPFLILLQLIIFIFYLKKKQFLTILCADEIEWLDRIKNRIKKLKHFLFDL